ncbi:MAG: ABC transporter ATP-binding protein [Lachnospiraceae bacterium]|nr:ABC transporter ATP-binding protein [Lachnospiraceae bacterium]
MVKGKRKLFWSISVRHSIFLMIYVVMAVILSEIVIRGNDYIAEATDRMLTGLPIQVQSFLPPLAIMIVVGTVVAYMKSLSGNHYSALVQRDVREHLWKHLMKLPYSYFDEKGSGSILTKFSSDVGETGRFYSEILPELLVNLATVITVTVYFLQMDVRLIVILFACYPVMVIVVDKLSKRLAKIVKRYRTRMDDRTQIAYDVIQGIAVERSFQLYNIVCRRIGAVIDDIATQACKSTRISSMGWLLKGVITTIPVVICYLFALYEVMMDKISVGDMLAFTVLLGRIIYPLGDIVFCVNDIRTAKVAMDRLELLYEAETEQATFGGVLSTETEQQITGGFSAKVQHKPAENTECAIAWKGVAFAYESSRKILKDITFEVKQGERIAFVGGSGEGKSTIFRLLCGLYPKQAGEYRLFGKAFEEWELEKLRSCFSVVSQQVFLLPQSILQNVACGKLDATREEIIEACKAANIHTFIQELPQGYDTPVGERGVRLSGGERQRISIARAFLKDAPIILLDEPTSAVDADTEKEIQEAIERIAKGKTIIIIAHRLSTIRNADCIYVVNQGCIAESGYHEELLEKKGIYAQLYGKEVMAGGE